MQQIANRNGRDFGWEIAHAAVFPRHDVARTHRYTYAANVWDLSIVQGPFPVAPCQLLRHDSQLCHRCTPQPSLTRSLTLSDGDPVPVPHFGLAMSQPQFQQLADKLRAAEVEFVIEPHLRFQGMPGEQWTMFFKDPSGPRILCSL